MSYSFFKYIIIILGILSFSFCSAQNKTSFYGSEVIELPLLGSWNFLLKSTGVGDTMNYSIANSYNFFSNNVYEHKENGEVVERGNWKLNYDTLLLSNKIWYKKSAEKSNILEKREIVIFKDRNSFFIKTTREGKNIIILFQRGIKHNGDLKIY